MRFKITSAQGGLGVAGIFFAGAIVELGRIVLGRPWSGFTPPASNSIGWFLALLWSAAAVAVLLRARSHSVALVAWMTALPAALAMFVHGVITTWGAQIMNTARIGLVYVLAGVGALWMLRHAFDRGILSPMPAYRRVQTEAHA